jgi:hypothetical protein
MMTLKAELHQDFDDFGADLKKRIWKIHLSVALLITLRCRQH